MERNWRNGGSSFIHPACTYTRASAKPKEKCQGKHHDKKRTKILTAQTIAPAPHVFHFGPVVKKTWFPSCAALLLLLLLVSLCTCLAAAMPDGESGGSSSLARRLGASPCALKVVVFLHCDARSPHSVVRPSRPWPVLSLLWFKGISSHQFCKIHFICFTMQTFIRWNWLQFTPSLRFPTHRCGTWAGFSEPMSDGYSDFTPECCFVCNQWDSRLAAAGRIFWKIFGLKAVTCTVTYLFIYMKSCCQSCEFVADVSYIARDEIQGTTYWRICLFSYQIMDVCYFSQSHVYLLGSRTRQTWCKAVGKQCPAATA